MKLKATAASRSLFCFLLMVAYFITSSNRFGTQWRATGRDLTELQHSGRSTFFSAQLRRVCLRICYFARSNSNILCPASTHFFAASFVPLFMFGTQSVDDAVYVRKSFYVWVSVFLPVSHLCLLEPDVRTVFTKAAGTAPVCDHRQRRQHRLTLAGTSVPFLSRGTLGNLKPDADRGSAVLLVRDHPAAGNACNDSR